MNNLGVCQNYYGWLGWDSLFVYCVVLLSTTTTQQQCCAMLYSTCQHLVLVSFRKSKLHTYRMNKWMTHKLTIVCLWHIICSKHNKSQTHAEELRNNWEVHHFITKSRYKNCLYEGYTCYLQSESKSGCLNN